MTDSVDRLAAYIEYKKKIGPGERAFNDSDSEDEIRPFKGFAKPLSRYKEKINGFNVDSKPANRLLTLIQDHVDEAMTSGFDDSIAKFKGKGHFVVSRKFNVRLRRN